MIRKTVLYLFTLISFLQLNAQAPRTYTSSEILLQLKKLNTVGSVLYIAAHPDDENTRLIAYLANEKCLRTGYLSLTRGDGGQNLIGPEQGVELGVIRTQELLAARRVDGGEQFFTRAYDFGFSKTPEETFNKWNRDSVLSDVVWVIRNFRPDIIITRFATDGSGGHGHHTASAILAEEAFDAAGDPTRFPEQLQYVEVWQPRRMFYNTVARFRDPNADMSAYIPLDVGGYNPLLGKSYGEIAAESRSMHKSQGFGSARQRGEFLEHFKPIKGDTAGLKDIFQGMDFSWKREKSGEIVGKKIDRVIAQFNINNPERSTALLHEVNDALEIHLLKSTEVGKILRNTDKFDIIDNIIRMMNGIVLDASGKAPYLSIGDTSSAIVTLVSRSALPFTINAGKSDFPVATGSLQPNKQITEKKPLNVKSLDNGQQYYSNIFWLQKPVTNNLFNIDRSWVGFAEGTQYFNTSISLIHKNINLSLHTPVQYRWVDPEKGELYRPLVITPPVMINVMNDMITFSDDKEKKLAIVIKAGKDSINGQFRVMIPDGWKMNCDEVPSGLYTYKNAEGKAYTECPFSLNKKGQEQTFHIAVTPLHSARNETIRITAIVNGEEYSKGIKEIKYDHIPVQTLFPEAEVKLVKLDVKKKLKRIGYIPGAGDEVQACLTQLGYEVTTLTDDKLANENLSQYEAIITGVRAYNTNEKLPSFKQRLMDYVAAGGNLVVQYNTNSWAGPLNSDIGPYPFKITRDRITDEDAMVNFELPDHPVLNTPNKITEKDFEGWIQERSIYHANDWGNAYEAPLSMADPNEKTSKGALIIGKHGKGNFIYTGLVFFRELPAGVPGAYRLMVNIIELGK